MSFSHSVNFNAVSLGPFTTAAKTTAWGQAPSFDGDPLGTKYSIVTGGKNGGQCCQCFYPAHQNGNSSQEYQMFNLAAGLVTNVEFDFKFLSGFDLTKDVGKLGPNINWGPRSGPTGGVSPFIIWNQAKTNQPATFTIAVQNQATGGNYNQPIVRSAPIVIGQWYHWKIQMLGGPGGYVTAWLDGLLFASYTNITTWPTTLNQTVFFADFFHYGGGGPGPSVDCYALQDNIQYYSGTGSATLPIVSGTITLDGTTGVSTVVFKDESNNDVAATSPAAWTSSAPVAAPVTPIAGQQAQVVNNGSVSQTVTLRAIAPNGVVAQTNFLTGDVPAPSEEVTGGEGDGADWWGPQNPLEPIFPLNPTLGYVPPVVPVDNAPPEFALWGYDTGWIGYVRNS